MAKRSGVFLVKTDWWYIERLVWLIAGSDVVLSSILTTVHNPNWAFSILFVGICSITVALTGFCIVGNILYFLGVRPLVPDKKTYDQGKWNGLYFMENNEWFLERYIYVFVGVNLSISSMLARFVSPYWLYFTGFVGTATILFAFTGFCIMANFLYRLGLEPRMCRNI
jgi:Inner membrane protein YgaP-like, transmembrane domain